MKNIGILGAGFMGQAFARLFMQAGYEVMLSNSRSKNSLFSVASSIGCHIGNQTEAIEFGDIVLIAIPFVNYTDLPVTLLKDKLIIDTMNYYPDRDGHFTELDHYQTTTSEMLVKHLGNSKVVKAFNAILAKDIVKDAKPNERVNRRALPLAGDDAAAKQTVSKLIEQCGYDYVDAGNLANGWRFERAKPAYCIPLNREQLLQALDSADRYSELPHNSWKQV